MAAALNGHPAVVAALLAKGAKSDAADTNGGTALRYAASKGHADIVDMLTKAGAKWTEAEFMLAAANCHSAVAQFFVQKGANANAADDGRSALHLASARGCADTARTLLAAGARVNARDANGRTPLMDAAGAGAADLVQLLLAAGADPNAMDDLERTPLMFAELSRVDEVIELLRARTGKYRFEEP